MNSIKFDKEQAGHLSQKYAYISSDDVVELMAKANFKPVKVWDKNKGYQRIDFTENQSKIVGDAIPTLTWINSFDGSRCAELMAGLFRLVCSNGLKTPLFGDRYSFRHVGFNPERCLDAVNKAARELPEIFNDVEKLKSKELNIAQSMAFAHKAIQLRFNDPNRIVTSAEIRSVLMPRRSEDQGTDAWTTFNVVQENLVRGLTRADRSAITVRAIQSGKTDAEFNKALWQIAMAA